MIDKYLNKVHVILNKNGIDINCVIVEWVFSLFCSLIPFELQIEFFTNFFEEGWYFFYKVSYFLFKSKDFESVTDSDDIYMMLRLTKSHEDSSKERIDYWYNILTQASTSDIEMKL